MDRRVVWLLAALHCLGVWTGIALAVKSVAGAILLPPREMTPSVAQMDPTRELWAPHATVMQVCARALGSVPRGHYYRACYLRKPDLVVLPRDWPSRSETRDLRIHEHAHRVFGWRH